MGRIQVNYRFSLLGGILFIPVRLRFKRYFSNNSQGCLLGFTKKLHFEGFDSQSLLRTCPKTVFCRSGLAATLSSVL
ncbi:hypothetical protein FFZ95_04290 [Leptospira borgpetersenii]|nr:hypothetical protein FFZ95_04290 [Leptospira borgpetersenii]